MTIMDINRAEVVSELQEQPRIVSTLSMADRLVFRTVSRLRDREVGKADSEVGGSVEQHPVSDSSAWRVENARACQW